MSNSPVLTPESSPVLPPVKTGRGPGRPPSDAKNRSIIRNGIVPESDYVVEFYWALPEIFKRLYSLYKSIKVPEVIVHFKSSEIIFEAQSPVLKNTIKTTIDATKCHKYHCKKPISFFMSPHASEHVINRIDPKIHDSICFMITEESPTNMIIALNNPKLESTSFHEINIQTSEVPTFDQSWDLDPYEMNFMLSKNDFKKYIGDIKPISDKVMIVKSLNDPLKFRYMEQGGVLDVKDVFHNEKKIKLNVTKRKASISATVPLNNILPIANTRIHDEIYFYVSNTLKLMLVANMDLAITTQIAINVSD